MKRTRIGEGTTGVWIEDMIEEEKKLE